MKKMKKFLIASMCIAAVGVIAAPVTSAIMSGKAADTLTWEDINLETEYCRDDTIVIPERNLSINGNTYDAVIKLKYPNGDTKMVQSGEFRLAQPGQYTLIYEAKDDNSISYTDEETFLVADKLWSVGNTKSSIEYGTVGAASGLLVKLAKGDALTFNEIIDLNNFSATDTLVSGFINPENVGTYEFDKLVFTLTDATDPTQTLTIRGHRSTTNNQMFGSYWTSAGPNQVLAGMDGNSLKYNNIAETDEGICGRYAHNVSFYSCNGAYGSQYPGGYTYWSTTADQCPFKVGYDKANVRTFVNNLWVGDLDDGEYHADEPTWKGFPSNKVFLSVQALDVSGEAANICITSVFGYDFTDENYFVETDAPEITVDVDEKYVLEQDGSYTMIPTAVKGANYPVSAASAYDSYSGNVKVETKVYHNYTSDNRSECRIKNGTFEVKKTGTYAIVYTARDNMGNVAEKIYWVNAVAKLENPLTIAVDTAEADLNGLCGETITIAPYEVTGGSGDTSVTVTASCGDTTLDATKGSFVPEVAGEWTVEYKVKDYAGSESVQTYTVTVEAGTLPIFVEEPLLPKYLISTLSYSVPTVKANDYSSGEKVVMIADMILVDANGETQYKVGETFVPVVAEGSDTITLKFVAGDAELIEVLPVVEPFVVVNNRTLLYIEKMFAGDNFTATRTRDGLLVETVANGSAKWTYANAFVAENVSLLIKGSQNKSHFGTMKVTFTDYANDNISVTLNLENQENGYARAYFGNLNRELVKGFNFGKDANGDAMDEFTFSYVRGEFKIDKASAVVAKDDQGNDFNGFPSGRVYISVETTDAAAGSQYYVKRIDNHIINTATTDRTEPRVAIVGEYGGIHSQNDIYSIAPAYASDSLDADVSAVVSVRTPSGELVADVNGLLLDNVPADKYYDIKLTDYGQYKVIYKAVDYTNAVGEISHTINVFDEKAPTATVATTWSATAKVGETVELPEIYIADDYSSIKEMKVVRYVRNPYGRATMFGTEYKVTDFGEIKYYKYTFTFNNVGEYTFINVVYDGAGNQRTVEYTVTVEE